jgi:hypothetical protein
MPNASVQTISGQTHAAHALAPREFARILLDSIRQTDAAGDD